MLYEFVGNLKYAIRQLRRSPGFAAAIVATLGLCIGVNTAVFSVIDAALLRPLPYPQPDRLVEVWQEIRRGGAIFSNSSQDGHAWEALKTARGFRLAAIGGSIGVNLGVDNRSVYVRQQRVSAGYFSVLGVPLSIGREFSQAEDRPAGPNAVVLSFSIWKRFFNADPSIVGHTILLRGEPYLVTGVTSQSFNPRSRVDLWTPLRPSTQGEGAGTNYSFIGRLNLGITLAQAQTETQTLGAAAFTRRNIPSNVSARMSLAPFEQSNQSGLRERLLILSVSAAVVLLIGCVNIASLMLARGSARRREMGTRIALGGRPASLIRQLITESFVLGVTGGASGLALGYATILGLRTIVVRFGVWQDIQLDHRVLSVTALLSILVSLLFGMAPAIQAIRVDVREALVEGGGRSVAGGHSHRLRYALVFGQIALCQVLLIGAALLIRTLLHLQLANPGFDASHVLTASASLQDARYSESTSVNRLFRDSVAAIRAIPGVEIAAVGLHVPYQRWLNSPVGVRGTSPSLITQIGTTVNYVTPGYFTVLRIPVRNGRAIDERDNQAAIPVAIINETFARKFLSNQSPLSAFILTRYGARRVVGVVGDLQQRPGLSASVGPIANEPAVYVPAAQMPSEFFRMAHTWFSPNWVVKATGPRGTIAREIEQAINTIDPLLPLASVQTMVEERDTALKSQSLNAWLLGSLAALALLLALVGIYGVVATSVVERTREFGIRIALGSSTPGVIWNAVAPGVWLSAGGVTIGGLLALACVRVLTGLLYGVKPVDAPSFLVVSFLSGLIGVVAALIPALGLTRLSPATILRQE